MFIPFAWLLTMYCLFNYVNWFCYVFFIIYLWNARVYLNLLIKQESNEKEVEGEVFLKGCSHSSSGKVSSFDNGEDNSEDGNNLEENFKANVVVSDGTEKENPNVNGSSKCSHDSDDMEVGNKRCRTVVIESDDEVQLVNITSDNCRTPNKDPHSPSQTKSVDIIDVDILPSPCLSKQNLCRRDDESSFHCTGCYEGLRASEVRRHPQLQVIVCESCSFLIEEKMKLKV